MVDEGGRLAVQAGLKQIVETYEARGTDLSSDPRLAEAILLDSFPESPAAIRALVEAIRSGAIQYMRDRAGQGAEFSISGSASQLAESAGLRDDLARWAAETWWTALSLGDLVAHREMTVTDSGEAAPASPAAPPPTSPVGVAPPPTSPVSAAVAGAETAQPLATEQGQNFVAPAAAAGAAAAAGVGAVGPPTDPQQFTPTQQPSYQATYQNPPPGAGTQQPPFQQGYQYPGGGGAPPSDPLYRSVPGPPPGGQGNGARGKVIAAAGVVVIVIGYLVIASVAHIAPFHKTSTSTTTTTQPHGTSTGTPNQVLLSRIPNSSSCTLVAPSVMQQEVPGAVAEDRCQPVSGDPPVEYALFPNQSAATTEFNEILDSVQAGGLPSGSCNAGDGVEGPYHNDSAPTVPVGTLACFESQGSQFVNWLHSSDHIIASVNSSDLSLSTLLSDWTHFGPA